MTIIQLATIFFIVTNPVGNCPTIIALIKDYSIREQQKILFREAIFAMLLAISFLFLGEIFLTYLQIENYALTFSGGILLFLLALKMMFTDRSVVSSQETKKDPFIVPIATPILSGAGLLSMIMLYAKQEDNNMKVFCAILLAWVGITTVLVSAPYMQIFLGKRGLNALEQLMGMLLCMVAVEMMVNGMNMFLSSLR